MPFKPTKHGQLIAKVAAKYKCSIETVRGWEKEGAPIDKPRLLSKWLDGRKSGNDELEPEDLKAAKLSKIKAETQRIKFRLKVEQGEYTPNDEVISAGAALGSLIRTELLLLCSEAPTWQGLDAAIIQDKAKAFVSAALERLTGALDRISKHNGGQIK